MRRDVPRLGGFLMLAFVMPVLAADDKKDDKKPAPSPQEKKDDKKPVRNPLTELIKRGLTNKGSPAEAAGVKLPNAGDAPMTNVTVRTGRGSCDVADAIAPGQSREIDQPLRTTDGHPR